MAANETIELEIINGNNDATTVATDAAAESLLDREALLRSIFDSINPDGDELVDANQLAIAIIQSNPKIEIPAYAIRSLFEKGDQSEDCHINYEEFSALAKRSKIGTIFKKFIHRPTLHEITTLAKKYKDSWNRCPPPIINITIILVEIGIFVYDTNQGTPNLTNALAFTPSNKTEYMRYLTYSLVHDSWSHLIFNSIFQLFFGTILEFDHGYRVALIFLAGVFGGSLTSAVLDNTTDVVGASGGVYALILSWVPDIYLNFSERICPMISLLPVISFIVWDWSMMRAADTSFVTHVAGGCAGLIFGMVILKNEKELGHEKYWKKVKHLFNSGNLVRYLCFGGAIGLIAFNEFIRFDPFLFGTLLINIYVMHQVRNLVRQE